MRIGIISAMDSEHRRLAGRLVGATTVVDGSLHYVVGRLGANELVLTQCGIGKVHAAVGTAELIRRYRPGCVVSTGVAGGIDPVLRVADVVVSRQVVYHDVWCGEGCAPGQVQGLPLYFDGCGSLVDLALGLNPTPALADASPHCPADASSHCPTDASVLCSTSTPVPCTDESPAAGGAAPGLLCPRIHAGLICTGDRFITDRAELEAIKRQFPQGLAVDMESAAIAQTCHLYGTPFISFRIISDTPGIDNHLAQYADFWGALADRSFATTWAFLSALPDGL